MGSNLFIIVLDLQCPLCRLIIQSLAACSANAVAATGLGRLKVTVVPVFADSICVKAINVLYQRMGIHGMPNKPQLHSDIDSQETSTVFNLAKPDLKV